jgi:protein-disulfide isomerase
LAVATVAAAGAGGRVAGGLPGQERGTGHGLGSADAPVVVTVFSDFGCPSCAVFARRTFPVLREQYVETGRVRWLHVPFVLGSFRHSERAAQAAECAADQDRFWEMHDVLFERQAQWSRSGDPLEHFGGYALEIGLEHEAFEAFGACLGAGLRLDVGRGNEMAVVARIRASPTFFIDGKRLEGAVSAATFGEILDQVLATKDQR